MCLSHQQSFSAMLSPTSIAHGAGKPCRSRRSKSKNISIKQWGGTMLPLTVASLYLGHPGGPGRRLGAGSGWTARSLFDTIMVHKWAEKKWHLWGTDYVPHK